MSDDIRLDTTDPFEQMILDIRKRGFEGLVSAGQDVVGLMDAVVPHFEARTFYDQQIVCALLFGQLCAVIEGETTTFERLPQGRLIGFEERLRIFNESARAVFKEAYAFRSHPDCPGGVTKQ